MLSCRIMGMDVGVWLLFGKKRVENAVFDILFIRRGAIVHSVTEQSKNTFDFQGDNLTLWKYFRFYI